MPQQSDFPDQWTGECPQKRVRVEVRVPDDSVPDDAFAEGVVESYNWVEIPTSSVEQWVEKGEAARIQRTAKVTFPTEWGDNDDTVLHNSPLKLVRNIGNPFPFARIWFQDRDGTWVISHFGWVGGVGATSTDNESKLWVYDVAEFLAGVPIGTTFRDPSIKQAVESIAKLTNGNTPIPVSEAFISAPNTEDEFRKLASNARAAELGGTFTLFDSAVDAEANLEGPDGGQTGAAYFVLTNGDAVRRGELDFGERRALNLDPNSVIRLPKGADENFSAITIDTGNDIVDLEDTPFVAGPVFGALASSKSFTSDHDTLLDVYEWFEDKTSAKLHFEPTTDSVVLYADIVPSRRTFAQDAVIRQKRRQGNYDHSYHQAVTVSRNNALYEIKPVNRLHLRGTTSRGILDAAQDFRDGASDVLPFVGPPPAEEYPVVVVEAPALVEAAGGIELSAEVVESDAQTLAEARREATRLLGKRLEETTEGEIILSGTPRMMPFDKLESFEVCNGNVVVEPEPATYEIESVKHVKKAGEPYKTRAMVSIWANDETIETVRAEMVEVGG